MADAQYAYMPNALLAKLKPVLAENDALLDSEKSAALIIETRVGLSISQKALAIEMGITQSYLSDLEHNNRRWSLAYFNKAKAAMEKLLGEQKNFGAKL